MATIASLQRTTARKARARMVVRAEMGSTNSRAIALKATGAVPVSAVLHSLQMTSAQSVSLGNILTNTNRSAETAILGTTAAMARVRSARPGKRLLRHHQHLVTTVLALSTELTAHARCVMLVAIPPATTSRVLDAAAATELQTTHRAHALLAESVSSPMVLVPSASTAQTAKLAARVLAHGVQLADRGLQRI